MNRTDLAMQRLQAQRPGLLWRPCSLWLRWAPVLLWGLAGCAQVQVRSVSPGVHEPAYELRAPSLARAHSEARRLCPAGHVVLRQAERDTRTAPEWFAARWWDKATGLIDDNERQAQLAVACKTPAAP